MTDPATCLVVATAVLAIAADLCSRTIPNWISGGAAAAGLAWHTALAGWNGMGFAALGMAAGAAVFAVFSFAGGMGGGDVKLMAGLGALLGAGDILVAALFAALAGGIHAAAALLWLRVVRRRKAARIAIPYAPAIAIGACLALVGRN